MIFFAGTRVIRVFAVDEDGSGPNGQVTYSIVSTHNKFVIDANTGWLSTSAVSISLGAIFWKIYVAVFGNGTVWL
jgi:hypothetical protein